MMMTDGRGSGSGSGSGNAGVFDTSVTRVVLEIDYETNQQPYTGNIIGFGDTFAPTMTNIDRLFAHKKMLTIPQTVPEMENIGSIPDEWSAEGSLQGLVVNQITSLDNKEAELLRQGFPGLNTEKLLLLEADRHPAQRSEDVEQRFLVGEDRGQFT